MDITKIEIDEMMGCAVVSYKDGTFEIMAIKFALELARTFGIVAVEA